VDLYAISSAKIPIIGAARTFGSIGVCGVKNRLAGDFLGFTRKARQTPSLTIETPKGK
jgi:hypothetical protein